MNEEDGGGGGAASAPSSAPAQSASTHLVKSLLFPSYTDAGSNEAFQSSDLDAAAAAAAEADISNEQHNASMAVEESMLTHTGAGLNRSAGTDTNTSTLSGSSDNNEDSLLGSPTPKSPLVPPTPASRLSPLEKSKSQQGTPASKSSHLAGDRSEGGDEKSEDATASSLTPSSPPKMLRKTAPPLPPSSAHAAAAAGAGAHSADLNQSHASSVLGTKFLDRSSATAASAEVSSTVSTNVMGNLSPSHDNFRSAEVSSTVSTNVMDNLSLDVALANGHPVNRSKDAAAAAAVTHELSDEKHVDDGQPKQNGVLHLSAENLEKMSPAKAMKKPFRKDEDADEVNSMTSHMGSEPGERKLRLDEVVHMEALAESEGEGDDSPSSRSIGSQGATNLRADLSMPALAPRGTTARSISTSANIGESSGLDSSPTATAATAGGAGPSTMQSISAAIHRIGDSISSRTTPATPNTPLSGSQSPKVALSSSVASILRSPGGGTNTAVLSPRFASLSAAYRRTSPASSQQSQSSAAGGNANIHLSPFRRATGCMSFDSSVDDKRSPNPSPSMDGRSRKVYLQHRNSSSPKLSMKKRSQSWDSETVYRSAGGGSGGRPYFRYESDPTVPPPSPSPSSSSRRRRYPESPRQGTGISSARAGEAFRRPVSGSHVRSPYNQHPHQQSGGSRRANPSPHNTNVAAAVVPQRIEIEREDAINLLSCLVQTSIAFDDKGDDDKEGKAAEDGKSDKDSSEEKSKPSPDRSTGQSEIDDALKTFRIISEEFGNTKAEDGAESNGSTNGESNEKTLAPDHDVRMKVIDELIQSHTYAVEMKRAAYSASSWLKAIGRLDNLPDEQAMGISYSYSNSSAGDGVDLPGGDELGLKSTEDPTKMEVIALRARLNAAEAKTADQSEHEKRLNDELAMCKAEIGRLKSTSNKSVFASPNKSIFDMEEEDASVSSSDASGLAPLELEKALNDVSAVADNGDALIPATEGEKASEENKSVEVDQAKEIILLKAALDEAKSKLSKLENVLSLPTEEGPASSKEDKSSIGSNDNADDSKETKTESEGDNNTEKVSSSEPMDSVVEEVEQPRDDSDTKASSSPKSDGAENQLAPSILSNPLLEKDLEKYKQAIRKLDQEVIDNLKQEVEHLKNAMATQSPVKAPKGSPGNRDERMINVRMLDGENFVTDWDLMSPLPPPPDHVLRSPIVFDLLSQWTTDQRMHESLLGWVESVLGGEDPANVPPLKISSLDHQLKDGFTMHILPILLRRPDIHVEITTRAHRRTSYDIAVTVATPTSERNRAVSFGSVDDTGPRQGASSKHLMAFKASKGGIAEQDEEDIDENTGSIQQHVRNKVSEYLRGGNSGSGANINNISIDSMAGSIANASDVTSLTSNRAKINRNTGSTGSHSGDHFNLAPRLSQDDASIARSSSLDEHSTGSSLTGGSRGEREQQEQQQEQQGLVGRAMGLLSLRKDDLPPRDITSRGYDAPQPGPRLHMPSLAEEGGKSLGEEEEEQYHRVVSVPPGKIGITFVQYRGHCMVSDVSPHSPLLGWIFPSDIVIAVDEKAVSGLRVREIVDLLKSRTERQRALRVISSHDLTDIIEQEASTSLLG